MATNRFAFACSPFPIGHLNDDLRGVEARQLGVPVEMPSKEKVYVPELGQVVMSSNVNDTQQRGRRGRKGLWLKPLHPLVLLRSVSSR